MVPRSGGPDRLGPAPPSNGRRPPGGSSAAAYRSRHHACSARRRHPPRRRSAHGRTRKRGASSRIAPGSRDRDRRHAAQRIAAIGGAGWGERRASTRPSQTLGPGDRLTRALSRTHNRDGLWGRTVLCPWRSPPPARRRPAARAGCQRSLRLRSLGGGGPDRLEVLARGRRAALGEPRRRRDPSCRSRPDRRPLPPQPRAPIMTSSPSRRPPPRFTPGPGRRAS